MRPLGLVLSYPHLFFFFSVHLTTQNPRISGSFFITRTFEVCASHNLTSSPTLSDSLSRPLPLVLCPRQLTNMCYINMFLVLWLLIRFIQRESPVVDRRDRGKNEVGIFIPQAPTLWGFYGLVFSRLKVVASVRWPLHAILLILWVPPLVRVRRRVPWCHSLIISPDFYKEFLCLSHLFPNSDGLIQACHLFLINTMTERTSSFQILPLFALEPTDLSQKNPYVLIFQTFLSQLKASSLFRMLSPLWLSYIQWQLIRLLYYQLDIYWLFRIIVPFSILNIPSLSYARMKPLYTPPCCYITYNAAFLFSPGKKAPSLTKSNWWH